MSKNPRVYSPLGITEVANPTVVADSAPTVADINYSIGQLWADESTNTIYVLVDFDGNGAVWTASASFSGAATVTSLVINPGNLDMTAGGDLLLGTSGGPYSDTTQYGNISLVGNITQVGDVAQTGNSVITGDLTVTGTFTNTTSGATHIISTDNIAEAIFLEATGGTSATIVVENTLGNSANAISLLADAGGINSTAAGIIGLTTSSNNASAIALSSGGGISLAATGAAGKDINLANASGSMNLTAGESAGDAIVINATAAAGGVQIKAGSAGILIGDEADTAILDLGNIAPTSNRTITVGGGTVVTAAVTDDIIIGGGGATTNANSVKQVDINTGGVTLGQVLTNIASGVVTSGTHTTNIASGNRAAGTMAVNVGSGTGTKTISVGNADGLSTINLNGVANVNASVNANVNIATGTSTGAVAIGNSLAGAFSVNTASTMHIDAADNSYVKVTGAAKDLNIQSVGGSVNVLADEAINDAIVLNASNAAGGVQIQAHAGGILIGDQADCSTIDLGNVIPTSARTITVAGGLLGSAVADTVNIATGGTNFAGSSKIVNVASDSNTLGTSTVNIGTGNRVSGTQNLNLSTGTGTKGINIGNTDGLSTITALGVVDINTGACNAATHINDGSGTGAVTIGNSATTSIALKSGSLIDLNSATNGNINIVGTSGTGTVTIGNSLSGAVSISSGSSVSINPSINHTANINTGTSTGAVNIGNSLAGAIAIQSSSTVASTSAGTTTITSTQASATAVQITASNGSGGVLVNSGGGVIALSSAGNVSMVPGTSSPVASPTATTEIDARVGKAVFTGFTTAAAASQTFTVTNSVATGSQAILATAVCAGTNDAQLSVACKAVSGTLTFTVTNRGSAAVNGNIYISWWILD